MNEEKHDISALYVEDDETARGEITRILGRRVRVLSIAKDGREGLELFRQHNPDLVVTDIRMPVMDGIAMAREIKALNGNARIIVTTAHGDTGYFLDAIDIGIDGYVMKPVDVEKFLDVFEKSIKTVILEKEVEKQNRERERLIAELQDALENIKTLRGFIPICSSCKKIRDDKGYWEQLETYITQHTEALFSHGICPDCMKILYPQYCKGKE